MAAQTRATPAAKAEVTRLRGLDDQCDHGQ